VIILRILPGLFTNGADIPELSRVDKVVARANPRKYVPLALKRQRRLAAAFREHMTKGQTYHTTNPNRTTFYTDVTNMAQQVNFLSFIVFVRITVFSSLWKGADNKSSTTKKNLSIAGTFRKAKTCKEQARCSVASWMNTIFWIRTKVQGGLSSSSLSTKLIPSLITRQIKYSGICSPSCVEFYDKSNISQYFRCSFRPQDASRNSPQLSILIPQPGPEDPTTVPWIRFQK
jgi:hypothetical protein